MSSGSEGNVSRLCLSSPNQDPSHLQMSSNEPTFAGNSEQPRFPRFLLPQSLESLPSWDFRGRAS